MKPNEYFTIWLKETGVQQVDVARVAGVTEPMITFWKTGASQFSAEKALKLEAVYADKGLCASKLCPVIIGAARMAANG